MQLRTFIDILNKYVFVSIRCIKIFQYNRTQKAPKDKLHIVDFKKGWKPLCEFLGVPVPDTPFPHKNKKGAILKELMETDKYLLKAQREGMVLGGVLLGVLAFGGYKLINFVYNDPNVIFNCLDLVKSVVNLFS